MIQYSEEARRNARHLLNIANAVLQGKPLQTWAKRHGQPHNGEWKSVDPDGDLLSKVYRSYRVAGAQQLELPKEKQEMITTKVTVSNAVPEDVLNETRRTAAAGSLWINPVSRYIYMLTCEMTAYRLVCLGSDDGRGQPEPGLLLDAHQNRLYLLRNLSPFTGSITLAQQVT